VDSGNSVVVGNLAKSRGDVVGSNSSLHGYAIGGVGGSTGFGDIERITFPFDSGTASIIGGLNSTKSCMAGLNSSTYFYIGGGQFSDYNLIFSAIERGSFASDSIE